MKRKKKKLVEEFIKRIDLQEKRALILPYDKEYGIRLVLEAGRIRVSIIGNYAHLIKDYPSIYVTPISILEKIFFQLIND